MEILTLETKSESNYLLDVLNNSTSLPENENIFHIGGISLTPRSTTDWYWVVSGKKLDFILNFLPNQPDFAGGVENCLSIVKREKFGFNDIICSTQWDRKFICQRDEIL